MQQRPIDDSRYPRPPGHHRSNSFLRGLPPPSPRNYLPQSPGFRDAPSPSGGHTDPSSWVQNPERPPSSRGMPAWSPSLSGMSPRTGESGGVQRLPPLADFPHRSATPWDGHHGAYPLLNQRGSSSGFQYRSTSPRVSINTPMTNHGPAHVQPDRPGSSSQSPGGTPLSRRPSQQGTVKDERNDSDPSAPKKKKRRVALSCAECAKRKQKCNRETPCQHCVSRRVPELCVPYSRHGTPPPRPALADKAKSSPGIAGDTQSEPQGTSRPPSMLPTLSVRVGRVEAMVNAIVNRVDGLEGKALNDWRINHAPATSPIPLRLDPGSPSDDPPHSASTASHMRRDGHDARDGTHELAENAREDAVFGLDRDTSIRNPLPQSMIRSTGPVPRGLDYHGTPAEQLQRLFEDCGVSPHKVQNLIQDLPAKSFADDLIAWFFSKINYVRYPIDEHLFRQAFEDVYSSQAIDSNHVIALPLVFIVLALAVRVAPDAWEYSEDQKRTSSLRFYWNSKNAILIASAVKAESLQLVETRILTGLYLVLMHERRLAEGWAEFRSAITTGQAIGLHRDGKKLGLDPYFTEYRRRLWSYLIHADATYSCLLGRPTSISLDCVDTLPPQNINLSTLQADPRASPQPMSEPTFATYLILRRRLGEIVAKVGLNIVDSSTY
ncbi:hypothetical protein BCR39DRAFT_554723 [Naematelia encephala]|uniref:Zn(2)-C6 fungal-type domain-containing protein n=1 Tax=Naematelia encephala TaxID=71784 RepID=A0A1Y2AE98_9TREE|nr:hypothetical protein BCR39DRAFT_554723 [Naematelia encephala]